MTKLFPVLLMVLLVGSVRAEGKPSLLKKVPPLDPIITVLKAADELTAENSSRFEAILQRAEQQPKLIVTTEEFDVTQTETRKIWRGSVSMTLTLPCKVSYAVSLANLQTTHYDPQRKLLTVRMADPEVASVEPLFERRQQPKMEYTRFCFSLVDNELEIDLLKQ